MALFTLQYGVEELEAYVIIFIIFLLWTVISVSKKITDVDRWNRNRDVFVLRQRREIIFLGFPPKFFVSFYFYLKMYIFLWGAWFPSEKSHVDRWNLHFLRCLCIEAAVRNHFLRFSERDFLFYSCLKSGLSATRKCTFSFEEPYFIKKITCWPNKSSQKCLWWGNGEKSFPFRTNFPFYSYLKKLFTSNLKMHIWKKRPTKTWNGL